ncbi:MAG TPA: hypothetical protein VG500_18235 [Gemmatimonadales bacterium]|nr:hypothetical protein [Gemmatimonadales bacterium]
MANHWLPLCVTLTLAGATVAAAQTERHVCRLLKANEIAAFIGSTVALANVVEDEPERSTCHYEDESGAPVFILTIYWKGGKDRWNASSAARGPEDRMVPGLGDAARFSDVHPSQVLEGDILVELHMSLLKDPAARFRPLAETLLKRL